MVILPRDYIDRMKALLGDEYDEFIKSYEDERYYGLRVNTSKISIEDFLKLFPYELKPIPWCETGFYYKKDIKPGKHPYHAAGLYYIQEPSAMAVVEALHPEPGDIVLDISAAPGGKSTQIANKIGETGLLVSNEINPLRAKALVENIERFGIRNAIILNESPERLLNSFRGFFDKIVVDAPCSGEGMFRKDPEVCYSWSEGMVKSCSRTQSKILEVAFELLKPGGLMSYSTCTFSPEENEQVIENFLSNHSELELVDVAVRHFFSPGRPDWGSGNSELSKCMRLWPHKIEGEGHFIAVIRKLDGKIVRHNFRKMKSNLNGLNYFYDFCKDMLVKPEAIYNVSIIGDEVYKFPNIMPDLSGLKVLRYGWHLGRLKKGRFEPSHAMALGLRKEEVLTSIDLESDGQGVLDYLRGHVISIPEYLYKKSGWAMVCVDGFSLGWCKIAGGSFKNHYPKELRINW